MQDWIIGILKSIDANTITALAAVITIPVSLYMFQKSQKSQIQQASMQRDVENSARQDHWENLARDEILAQASTSLEYAFNVLTASGQNMPPERNRLNWLTCGRHLIRYRALKGRLSGVHLEICAEREEFWRYQFYRCLRPLERSFGYFDQATTYTPEEGEVIIDIKSALVVLAFAEWPKDLGDPLDTVTADEVLKGREALLIRHFAFDRVYAEMKEKL